MISQTLLDKLLELRLPAFREGFVNQQIRSPRIRIPKCPLNRIENVP
jgi:hypothetical protein